MVRKRSNRNSPAWNRHDNWVSRQIVFAVYTKQTFKCAHCGFDDIDCLSLDHVNNDSKHNHNKYTCGSQNYIEAKRKNFPDKFQVLCRNCNWIKELEHRRKKWLKQK